MLLYGGMLGNYYSLLEEPFGAEFLQMLSTEGLQSSYWYNHLFQTGE
jgi:hypothetical protein